MLLSTAATVIASQAVISGAFSLLRQAIQLGLMPLDIFQTSTRERGQIYARAVALMRPWTQEIAMQQAWEAALGLDGEQGDAAGA